MSGLLGRVVNERGTFSVRMVYKRVRVTPPPGWGLNEDPDLPRCNDQSRDVPLVAYTTFATGHTFASTKQILWEFNSFLI